MEEYSKKPKRVVFSRLAEDNFIRPKIGGEKAMADRILVSK